MKTSYFANFKSLKETGKLFPISIATKVPSWVDMPDAHTYPKLAPKYDTLMAYKRGEIDKDEYTRQYKETVLSLLSPHVVYNELHGITYGDREPVLLCYEKPGDFCHRRIVAKWLEDNLNIKVEEYKNTRTTLKEYF